MSFNQQIIDAFRANNGEVNTPIKFGKGIVLVHVPKKDGSVAVTPLAGLRRDGAWHVVASAGGSPKHPAWTYGLRRAERVSIEVPGDPIQTVDVAVDELTGAERDEAWEGFKKLAPTFADYEKTAEGRVFPIFRLRP